jgi:hypothetical protein
MACWTPEFRRSGETYHASAFDELLSREPPRGRYALGIIDEELVRCRFLRTTLHHCRTERGLAACDNPKSAGRLGGNAASSQAAPALPVGVHVRTNPVSPGRLVGSRGKFR